MREAVLVPGIAGLAALLVGLPALAGAPPRQPNVNYALHCLGCHTHEGVSPERGRIPPLKGMVGHFSRIAEGRRYIVNVPGVANAGLGPAETAALLNWTIETYGGESIPADFEPFDEAEVDALRSDPPDDILRLREEVRALLQRRGYDLGTYP